MKSTNSILAAVVLLAASISGQVLACGSGAPHPNGGGWVENTARVSHTVYVGPNAKVCGNAIAQAYARITDNAVISDYGHVQAHAQVSGNAKVKGYAIVYQHCVVSGNAVIKNKA